MPAYAYILSSKGKRLYIGMTTDLEERIWEHKNKVYPDSFTARYNIDKLIWYEEHPMTLSAIAREKEIKGWNRLKKIQLIVSHNPDWRDLSGEWGRPSKPFKKEDLRTPRKFGDTSYQIEPSKKR